MWTEITRPKYERKGLRYATDLTDGEWELIEPFLPPGKPVGRSRTTDLREVVSAILYLLRGGCPWRMLPGDFPPRSTVQRYFYAWRDDATWRRINHYLLMAAREDWARRIRRRSGHKKACVALARKLAVILHRMLTTGELFRWPEKKEAATA